jgi:outer membrane protein TolC
LTASSASPTDTLAARHATDRARWTLADLIDVALDRNPLTRGAWEQARAAAARYAGERSAYLPAIDANANYLRQKSATGPGRAQSEVRSYGGTLDLSWLLFDFGGRESAVAVAHEAAGGQLTHSAALRMSSIGGAGSY